MAALDQTVDQARDDALDAAVALRRDGEVGRRDHRDVQRTRRRDCGAGGATMRLVMCHLRGDPGTGGAPGMPCPTPIADRLTP